MGAGKAGDKPIKLLRKRFSKSHKIVPFKTNDDVSKVLTKYLKKKEVDTCIFCVDTLQIIEPCLNEFKKKKKKNDKVDPLKEKKFIPVIPKTGIAISKIILARNTEYLNVKQCVKIINAMDCADCSVNETKDMVYYTIGKRRLNIKMMKMEADFMVIRDNSVPSGDVWKSLKLNTIIKRQINYYFANSFQRISIIPGAKFKGNKTVCFDNFISFNSLFDRKSDPKDLYKMLEMIYKDGKLISKNISPPSLIAEAELSASYHFETCIKENEDSVFVLVTTDQDAIHIGLLNKIGRAHV